MYTIEPYRTEIRLISNLNGLVGVYPDYESFLDSLTHDFIKNRIVITFKDWPGRGWLYLWRPGEPYERFVVRDKFGSAFSPGEIYNDFVERRTETYKPKWMWWKLRHEFIYRQTPVPLTGKKKWYFRNYYKCPKTTQERRWSFAHSNYVRGKRRSHVLPNTWDDRPRSDVSNRKCWKSKKIKRQWMKNHQGGRTMAKVWTDQGDGVYEATDTIVLERLTRAELVERKSMLEDEISRLEAKITLIDADITAIDAL